VVTRVHGHAQRRQCTRSRFALGQQVLHGVGTGLRQLVLTHAGGGRLMALAYTRSLHDAHGVSQAVLHRTQQVLPARHLARQAGAHAHSNGGQRGVVLHHVEVVVEGGHLVYLHLAQAQAFGQGRKAAFAQAALAVLQAVQVFNQQVCAGRQAFAQVGHALAVRVRHLAALGRGAPAPGGLPFGKDGNHRTGRLRTGWR